MKTQSTILHVAFHNNGAHFYFGSIAAIFELFQVEDIGASESHLRRVFGVFPEKPYVNKNCIIRKANLYRKKGNRGKNITVK